MSSSSCLWKGLITWLIVVANAGSLGCGNKNSSLPTSPKPAAPSSLTPLSNSPLPETTAKGDREPPVVPAASVLAIESKTKGIYAAAMSYDGRFALAAGSNGVVYLWDLETGNLLHKLDGFETIGEYFLAFSPDSRLAIASQTGGVNHRVRCKSLEISSGQSPYEIPARWFAVSPEGSMAVGRSDSFVDHQLFDLKTGKVVRNLPPTEAPNRRGVFSFCNDGKRVIVPHSVLETSSAKILIGPSEGAVRIQAMALSPDGRYALGAKLRDASDRGLFVWSLDEGKETARFHPLVPPLQFVGGTDYPTRERWEQVASNTAIFSPDSKTLAILEDYEGLENLAGHAILRLWDVETGQQIRHFGDRGGLVQNTELISFSPDGRYLLTTRELWDVASGSLLCKFGVTRTTFCLNGNRVLGDSGEKLAVFEISEFRANSEKK